MISNIYYETGRKEALCSAVRAPGCRPHEGQGKQGWIYPKGSKGFVMGTAVKHAVFRSGWARLNDGTAEEDPPDGYVRVNYEPPPAPENIRAADTK